MGFPHSDIYGSTLVRQLTVLFRGLTPSFFARMSRGIHLVLSLASPLTWSLDFMLRWIFSRCSVMGPKAHSLQLLRSASPKIKIPASAFSNLSALGDFVLPNSLTDSLLFTHLFVRDLPFHSAFKSRYFTYLEMNSNLEKVCFD